MYLRFVICILTTEAVIEAVAFGLQMAMAGPGPGQLERRWYMQRPFISLRFWSSSSLLKFLPQGKMRRLVGAR